MVTQTESYLGGSALVQKRRSQLLASRQGERSQGAPERGRREEARPPHSEGWHLGLNDVRASVPTAKHVSPSPRSFPERARRLASPAIRVLRAVTWRKRSLILTDEVSRRLLFTPGVRPTYKAPPTGSPPAPVGRRLSQQPPLQRWQQIGSSSPASSAVGNET